MPKALVPLHYNLKENAHMSGLYILDEKSAYTLSLVSSPVGFLAEADDAALLRVLAVCQSAQPQ